MIDYKEMTEIQRITTEAMDRCVNILINIVKIISR